MLKYLLLTLSLCILWSSTFGQEYSRKELKYKPKDLNEAVHQLTIMHHDTTKQIIMNMTEDEFTASAHFGMGMWIRNNWGLWSGGVLKDYFHSIGIFHPDDMSSIILTSYHRHLNKLELKVDEQVTFFQDYWKKTKEHQDKMENDSNYRKQIKATNDSIVIQQFIDLKNDWKPGTCLEGFLHYQCGFFSLGEMSKVKGYIVKWRDDKLVLKITVYCEGDKMKRLIKCNDIIDNIVIIENYRSFSKVE